MNRKLKLIEDAVTKLGYPSTQIQIEGSVADVTTPDNEQFSVLLYERSTSQMTEPCFSLSSNGIAECRACKCRYFAYVYGSKACAIVAVDAPDYQSKDEFGDAVHTYANPLLDA